MDASGCTIALNDLIAEPFAIFECKRVGVEEGMRKGPQTIEKAKQGAYVARSVSSLQSSGSQTASSRASLTLEPRAFEPAFIQNSFEKWWIVTRRICCVTSF